MNTILMAAARGARIEILFSWRGGCRWKPLYDLSVYVKEENINYRIHPDDDHLRFGPISSALRESAETDVVDGHTWSISVGSFWLSHSEAMNSAIASRKQRSLFLLILSEALAQEGL